MAGFAVSDLFIKLAASDLHISQIVTILGTGGAVIFGIWAYLRGDRLFSRDFLEPVVLARNLFDITGAAGFMTALSLAPISTASAVLQATPLAVTLGAALFLGETVGWRRWSAVLIGFLGVLMIVRPGTDGFDPALLFAVIGFLGLSARDLITRKIPDHISTPQIGAYAFFWLIPLGLIMLAIWGTPSALDLKLTLYMAAMIVAAAAGLFAITVSLRMGEVSAVSPFRYTRLVFAMAFGILIFGERPDLLTWTGSLLIIGSGLYVFAREHRLAQTS